MITDTFLRDETVLGAPEEIFWETDRADILAHIIPSRSRSLGTEPFARRGEISANISVEYGISGRFVSDRHYHSAQFLMNNMDRQDYWSLLMKNAFRLR